MDELRTTIGNYQEFLEVVLNQANAKGLEMSDFAQIDHICYRTATLDAYEDMQHKLEKVATLLGEVMINRRPISTYRLHEPIIHDVWRIDFIELPAPKENETYENGLEHLEFVLYDDIPTFLNKYSGITFDMRAADRGLNPEVGFKLDQYSVKFHMLSLGAVIYIENKLDIHHVNDGD